MWPRKNSDTPKFDSELNFHLDQLIQEKVKTGLSESEARRQAILEFGGTEQLKEELRDVHRLPFLETFAANLRFALRLIRKSPAFSATVVVTLALGIGANSAVFSAINAILLRPLPFPNSQQLVELRQFDRAAKAPYIFAAPTRVEDWNRLNTSFQAITGYYTDDISDLSGPLPEKITEALVAPRFLRVWGISPQIGRDFLPEEEHFGGPTAILISHRYWMHRFNGNPDILGQRIQLDKSTCTIVGVMPQGFRFLDHDVDIWQPSPVDAPFAQDRSSTWYYKVIGRLKPDVSPEAAEANLAAIQSQLGRQYPKTDGKLGVNLLALKLTLVDGTQKSLWLLYASVTLLLLIACINIAALLLARSAEREREIAVRFSLGASRGAVIGQLLTECFLLALAGSSLGLAFAYVGGTLFQKLANGFPRREEITLDWHIVLYTLTCAVVATLICGLIPAIRSTRRDINAGLNKFTRSQVSGRNSIQWLLVGSQVALAVMLLVGAGLMLRSFQQLGKVSAGFEISHILTFRISGNWGETADMPGLTRRMDRTLDTIRATPGVVAAATTAMLPGIATDNRAEVSFIDAPNATSGKISTQNRFVSNGYFQTLKIPLLSGQGCKQGSSEFSVLVNRSFVNAYLHGISPIGHHLHLDPDSFNMGPATIKGVAADTHEQGLNESPSPTLYWCSSAPFPTPYFLVQTRSNAASMVETLRRQIHILEPARSVYNISPLEVHLSNDVAPSRLRTYLLAAFALSAIALAATGIYGTLSYFVTVRRRESGLRLALGATRNQILTRFFVEGLRVAAIGCVIGLCLSLTFTKALSNMLFGITATDLPTWAAVALLVLTVAACASLLPALRAAAVEPMQVLRDE